MSRNRRRIYSISIGLLLVGGLAFSFGHRLLTPSPNVTPPQRTLQMNLNPLPTSPDLDAVVEGERNGPQPPPNLPRSSGEEKKWMQLGCFLPQRLGEIQRGLKTSPFLSRRLFAALSKTAEDTEGVDASLPTLGRTSVAPSNPGKKTANTRYSLIAGSSVLRDLAIFSILTSSPPSPSQVEELKQNALGLKQERRYKESLEEFQRLVEITPDDPEVHYHLATLIALMTSRTPEAIEHLNIALSLRPDFVPALDALAELYPLNDEYGKALETLDTLISLHPEKPYYLCEAADLCTRINEKEKSLAYLQQAVEKNPSDEDILACIGAVFSHWGEKKRAVTYLRKALEIDSGHARANYELASILVRGRELGEAETMALRSIRSNPFVQETHSLLARIYAATKRQTDAKRELQIAEYLNHLPEIKLGFLKHLLMSGSVTPEEHFLLGEELARVGCPDWGIQEMEAGLVMEPTAQAPRIPLALAYLEVGKPEEAFNVVNRLADPGLRRTEGALRALGWAAYHTKQLDVARGVIVAASAFHVESESLHQLSDALRQAPMHSAGRQRWILGGLLVLLGVGLLVLVRQLGTGVPKDTKKEF